MRIALIELAGLPGCGKSTLVNYIIRNYNYTKFVIRSNISSDIDFMWKHNWSIPFYFIKYFCLSKGLYKLKFRLCINIFQYKITKYSFIYSIYIIILIMSIQNNSDEDVIFLLDEGIVQFISSISHDCTIRQQSNINKIINHLKIITKISLYVKCDISIKDAINRIECFRNKCDRIQKHRKLHELLYTKEKNIDLILDLITDNKINIDMTNPIEYNAKLIIELIEAIDGKSLLFNS